MASALDPVAFVRATRPFDALPPPLFEAAARALDIGFYPAGSRLVERGGPPLQHLYVIRKGAVRLERDGQTVQLLEEGEIFGYTSLIARRATIDVVVEEDLLAYRIPGAEFERLLSDARFASHFVKGLGERLKSSAEGPHVATFHADLWLAVETLVLQPPVRVPAGATVEQAARLMRDRRVSSVLVDTEPPGILTDRDLRSRVLAEGLGPATPAAQVSSSPLRTVSGPTPIHEAWQVLLEAGIHHLPITRGDEIVGVLAPSDLLHIAEQGPPAVLRTIERLESRAALPEYGRRLTGMVAALLSGGLDAPAIARFVARLNDALTRRILRWAEAEMGPPPAPCAWIVFGSEGRMEQTLLTDQDNALVHGGDASAEPYFAALAGRVNQDLEAAGFPPCPGGYMARTWHAPLSSWHERFAGWVERPQPDSLLASGIFFDFRVVHGALDLSPLDAVLARAARSRLFIRCLAKAALSFQPPPSLFVRLRGENIDLKRHAIAPIVHLARTYALEAGSPRRNTLDRLEAAVAAGLMGADTHAAIREAYRFLLGVRLRRQLRAIGDGLPLDDTVALRALPAIERSRLKDSFRAIRIWQEAAAYRYQTDLF